MPIDYRGGGVVDQVRELTGGLGVPAVVECAGTAAAIRDCCLAAAKGGVVSVIGIPHEDPVLPMKRIVLDEIEIIGDRANPNTAEDALSLLVNGRVDLTPLLTHRFPLADVRRRAGDLRAAPRRRGEGGDQAMNPQRPPTKLYRTTRGLVIDAAGSHYLAPVADWDALFNHDDLAGALHEMTRHAPAVDLDPADLLAPIGRQEVWAAGVTYFRSRSARMEESKAAGGGDFYDRVYQATRPELFFKATPHRVVGPRGELRIRRDSAWNVPEPELALAVNARGTIIGYTIGNDMSSRDIEGENPLYLPQAKVYAQCCGLGPGLLVTSSPLDPATAIRIQIRRAGQIGVRRPVRVAQHEAHPGGAGRVPVPRQRVSRRMLPPDRHRHRPARRLHPARRRRSAHHHRPHRHADEHRRAGSGRALTGKNLIAGIPVDSDAGRFTAHGASTPVDEASAEHVDRAVTAADRAFEAYRQRPAAERAALLEQIAAEIEALGDELLAVAHAETALPIAERLAGERARTVRQLALFADLVRDGSWVDARIDRADPARRPPRPDLRRMLIPIGPVAVFAASNFPLAFSVAGTDTASALAAGCPVVVKAHPAHPATAELTAAAIVRAVETDRHARRACSRCSTARATTSRWRWSSTRGTKAVAFTGCLTGGRALFDAGAARPEPIPVYAEMGSVNPVFLLPGRARPAGRGHRRGAGAVGDARRRPVLHLSRDRRRHRRDGVRAVRRPDGGADRERASRHDALRRASCTAYERDGSG